MRHLSIKIRKHELKIVTDSIFGKGVLRDETERTLGVSIDSYKIGKETIQRPTRVFLLHLIIIEIRFFLIPIKNESRSSKTLYK